VLIPPPFVANFCHAILAHNAAGVGVHFRVEWLERIFLISTAAIQKEKIQQLSSDHIATIF
jgi:hypothetical protein